MRILVIIYEFPPVGGGGGRSAQNICEELVKLGHDVRVITAHLKGLPHRQNQDGIEVLRVSSARRLPFQAGLAAMSGYILAGFWEGLRQIRSWQPDVIHTHFAVPSGPVAWALWRLTGVPYVLTAHLGDVPKGVPEKTDRWFRWFYPFTHAIWRDAAYVSAVSKHTQELANKHYPIEIQIIPNGASLSQIDPGIIQTNNPPQIVFAGRFTQQKNLPRLVKTLANLKDLEWQCALLGDGPLRPTIEQEINQSGLGDRILLTGWINSEEVLEWFSKSDILFMPSFYEGLPVTGIQALAMGLAMVASNIGGFLDLVDDNSNGYLVDINCPNGFEDALRNLLSDKDRLQAFRQASRQKAKKFDIVEIARTYESLFISLTNQKNNGQGHNERGENE